MKVITFTLVLGVFFAPSAFSSECKEQSGSQIISISPTFISIFGNKPITVTGPFLNGATSVKFRFTDVTTITVDGSISGRNVATCIAPFFYTNGRIQVDLLVTRTDTTVQTFTGFIYTTKPSSEITFNIVNNDGFKLEWDKTNFDSGVSLDLELIELSGGRWTPRGVIVESITNTGSLSGTFKRRGLRLLKNLRNVYIVKLTSSSTTLNTRNPRPVDDCEGKACNSAFSSYLYHLGEKSEAELNELCYSWYVQDAGAPKDALHCPPTVEKAQVDKRFEQIPVVGDLALYNPEADIGYRQITESDSGAGQRCVYKNGILLTGPRSGGNVRSVSPNGKRGMTANFVADIMPWYACCALIKNQTACGLYYERRPSDDGSQYKSNCIGSSCGDPHITTFDGHYYTFNGLGEFWMTKIQDSSFVMQGRTEQYITPTGEKTAASVVTSVVMQQKNCREPVTVQLSTIGKNFQLLLDGQEVAYDTTPNQPTRTITHNGASIAIYSTSDIKICFSSGYSIEFTQNRGIIDMTIQIDVKLKGKTSALLGTFDDNQSNDYTLPNGNTVPISSTPEKVHDYGMQWGIQASESLFTYPPCKNYTSYENKNFVPSFEPPNVDKLPPKQVEACQGNSQCLFDLAVTGQLDVAISTLQTIRKLEAIVKINAVACPRPNVAVNGFSEVTNFFAGSTVKLVCHGNLKINGADTITCRKDSNGQLSWDGQLGTCVKANRCDNPNLWLRFVCEQNLRKSK